MSVTKNILSLILLISCGGILLLPTIITPALFPIYLIGTIIIVLILYKTNFLVPSFLKPNQLGLLYILLPQSTLIIYWIKNGLDGKSINLNLIMFFAMEIILAMGFFTVKLISRHFKKRNDMTIEEGS